MSRGLDRQLGQDRGRRGNKSGRGRKREWRVLEKEKMQELE